MQGHFEIKVDGVDLKDLAELKGGKGTYFACIAAGRPELENAFFYGDDHYQFFFYVTRIEPLVVTQTANYIIHSATNKQLGLGGDFRASADDVDYLEQNIRKLLQTRFFYDLKKISEAPDCEVKFIWRVAK